MLILSNLLIFLISQWSTDVQLTRTQSPELVHVNFGARFQVSHFFTNHSLGRISWKDYCVSNRQQTGKTSSISRFPAPPAPRKPQIGSKGTMVGKYRWNHSNEVFDWIQICGAQGFSARTNQYLPCMRLPDRWFINKNMAEKETIANGM